MRPAECAASSVVRVTGLARSHVKGCVSLNVNRKLCGVFHESYRCFVSSSITSDSEKHNSCYRQKGFMIRGMRTETSNVAGGRCGPKWIMCTSSE